MVGENITAALQHAGAEAIQSGKDLLMAGAGLGKEAISEIWHSPPVRIPIKMRKQVHYIEIPPSMIIAAAGLFGMYILARRWNINPFDNMFSLIDKYKDKLAPGTTAEAASSGDDAVSAAARADFARQANERADFLDTMNHPTAAEEAEGPYSVTILKHVQTGWTTPTMTGTPALPIIETVEDYHKDGFTTRNGAAADIIRYLADLFASSGAPWRSWQILRKNGTQVQTAVWGADITS